MKRIRSTESFYEMSVQRRLLEGMAGAIIVTLFVMAALVATGSLT